MELVYSNINIDVPNYKLSEIDKGVLLYELQIHTRQAKWYLQKKYSDFALLNSNLRKFYNNLPEFPQKSIFSLLQNENDELIRKIRLKKYLQEISTRQDIINSEFYKEFLQLQKNAPNLLINTPLLIKQFNIDPQNKDATKGVRDFYYDQQTKTFIIITGDTSTISRMNSYFTNTKLPWEEAEVPVTLIAVGTVECFILVQQNRYQKVWSKIYPAQATALHYNRARQRLLIGLDDGTIDELKVSPRNRYLKYQQSVSTKIHEERVTGIFYDSLNLVMYSTSTDANLTTFEMSTYYKIGTVRHMNELWCILPDTMNKRLFVGADEGHIYIYEYKNAKSLPRVLKTIVTPQEGPIRFLTLDLVRNYLFSAGFQAGLIPIFDIDKPGRQKFAKQIACFQGKVKPRTLIWIGGRMQILVGTGDGTVTFFDSLKGRPVYVLKAHSEQISQMYYEQKTRILITASRGKIIKFWQVPRVWRDQKLVQLQEQQVQLRRKVQNALKIKATAKRVQLDSDEDDLVMWYKESSSDEQNN